MPKINNSTNFISFINANKILVIGFLMIGMAGIVLRILWTENVPTKQWYDFDTFMEVATNIYEGNGHSIGGQAVAWVGPGYAYALAFFFKLMGRADIDAAKLMNLWLSSLTLLMSFFVFIRIFVRKVPDKRGVLRNHANKPAILAAYALTAVFPNIIAYNNVAGTETFFLFLLVCILLLQLYPLFHKVSWVNFALVGALTGLCTLTKPFMLVYPVILAVICWVDTKRWLSAAKWLLIAGIPCMLVVAPWTYRNYRHYGRFIPVSYNMGYNRQVNNNERNISGSWMPLEDTVMSDGTRALMEAILDDGRSVKQAYELELPLAREASKWIHDNRLAYMQLGLMRIQKTYFHGADDILDWTMNDWKYEEGAPSEYKDKRHTAFAMSLFTVMVNIVSAAGFIFLFLYFWPYLKSCFTKKRFMDGPENLLFLNIAFFALIVFAFEGQPRYNHSVLIFFIAALVWICDKVVSQRSGQLIGYARLPD